MNLPAANEDLRHKQLRARAKALGARYARGRNMRMTMWDALQQLRLIESDCDTRGLALAQSLQKNGHDDNWVALGLIHNLGKIMFLFGRDDDGTSAAAPWAVLGDTYVTDCSLPKANTPVDVQDSVDGSGVGLANVTCSFNRDEYLHQALERNRAKHKLSQECIDIARVQSLRAWHTGEAYTELEDDRDRKLKPQVQLFCAARDCCGDLPLETWDDPKWRDLVERVFGTEPWDF